MRAAAGFLLAAGAALLPAPAFAHAFTAGLGAYEAFVEGASVTMGELPLALPLLAFGLFAGLNRKRGAEALWIAFFAGTAAGLAAAAAGFLWLGVAALGMGAALGILTAISGRVPAAVGLPVAFVAGAAIMGAALEGHGLFELSAGTQIGILFGAALVASLPANLVWWTDGPRAAGWVFIGWRVAASWLAAMLLLYLAFLMRGPGTL